MYKAVMFWGIPVRPVIRAGLSARRGNEGEAMNNATERIQNVIALHKPAT
jgi:hypothetical protein